jgi:hypothetical protein
MGAVPEGQIGKYRLKSTVSQGSAPKPARAGNKTADFGTNAVCVVFYFELVYT